jgi:cellulose synthase operon protein C
MRKHILIVVTVLASLLVGCSDSPQHKFSLAERMLKDGKPSEALELVNSILEGDIDGDDAQLIHDGSMFIKAKAHLAMGQLPQSRKTLEKLMEEKPEDPEPVRYMIGWGMSVMDTTVKKSDFLDSEELRLQWNDGYLAAMEFADKLDQVFDEPAEAEFERAKITLKKARKDALEIEREKKRKDRKAILGDDAGIAEANKLIQRFERAIESTKLDAEKHLDNVLKLDPTNIKAVAMYLSLLNSRGAHEETWALAVGASDRTSIPATLAQELVMAVLRIPDRKKGSKARLILAEDLRDRVKKEERSQSAWLLAAAHIQLNHNEPEKARMLVEQVKKGDMITRLEARYLESWCLFQQERYQDAKSILEKISVKASGSAPILTLYGQTLWKLNERTLAGELARRAVQADVHYGPALKFQNDVLASSGNTKQVAQLWESRYLKNPEDISANRMKLSQHISKDEVKEIQRQMQRLERILTMQDGHLALLVDGYKYLKDYRKVLRYSKKLTETRPDQLAAHLRYAEAMVALDNSESALKHIESIKARFPDSGGTELLMARIFFSKEDYSGARRLLTSIVSRDPKNTEARLWLARSLVSLKRVDDAKIELEKILEEDPNHKEANALIVRVLTVENKSDEANERLSKIDPTKVDANRNPAIKAQILIQKNRLDEARDVCNSAIAHGATDPVLRLMLVRIYMLQKEPDKAEVNLLELAHSQPNNSQVYKALGSFYETTPAMRDKGVNSLKALQKASPVLARMALSGLYLSQGKHDLALATLNEVFDSMLKANDELAYDVAVSVARVHLTQKKVDEARDAFKRVEAAGIRVKDAQLRQIDLSWANPSVFNTMTRLMTLAQTLGKSDESLRSQVLARLARLEKPEKAIEAIDKWAVTEANNSVLYRWKGQIQAQRGEYEKAVEAYKQAISIDPDQLGLRVRLVSVYLGNFDYPAAADELRRMGEISEKAKAIALAELGQIYVRLGLNAEASKTFAELEGISKVHEPAVVYAMGRAMAALKQEKQARNRLAAVPEFARIYAAAQVQLAHLEIKTGEAAQARDRVQKLIKDPTKRVATMLELMRLPVRDREEGPRVIALLRAADGVMDFENVSTQIRSNWMRSRVIVLDYDAKEQADFERLEKALEDWQRLQPNSLPILAGRMAVLARIGRVDKARQLYRSVEQLAKTGYGPLLAVVVNLQPERVDERAPLPEYIVGMATGRIAQARVGIEALETRTTLYKKDLYQVLERDDVTKLGGYARQMATATVALDASLARLAESLAESLVGNKPDVVPGYGFLAQALLMQGKSTADLLERARKNIPKAGLTHYLAAENKVEARDFKGAIDDLKLLLETEPENIHAHYRLTQVLHLAGENELAISHLEKLHAKGGSYRVMVSNDLSYLVATYSPDRMDEAYGIAKRAHNLVSQQGGNALGAAALRDTLGWIEHLKGDDGAALKHLSRSIARLQDRPEVHYHLGVTYQQLGNTIWAKFHMERAASGDEKLAEVGKAKELLKKWGS